MPGSVPAQDPHQAFDDLADACVRVDREGICRAANAAARTLFKATPGNLLGQTLFERFIPASGEALRSACGAALARQWLQVLDVDLAHPHRCFEGRVHPLRDGVLIQLLDIGERKQADRAAQQHRRMLTQAQALAHVGSWEWNIVDNSVAWSSELYRIYGLTPRQYAATFEAYLGLVHPLDRARVRQLVEQAVKDHLPFEFEERIVRSDGSVRILHSRGAVDVDGQGHAVRMLGACQDITERSRADRLDAGQHHILGCIAAQHPLADNLQRIALLHETLNPGALCSLVLLDRCGTLIQQVIAPSMPADYNRWLHGMQIGDGCGSCGTAAWRHQRVVVADIARHPYWDNYREAALAHGLRACWSTPVFDSRNRVLGTFAVYYREPREPDAAELDCIDRMLPLTSIAIESAALTEKLHERNRFFEMSLEVFCIFDLETGRVVQFNPSLPRVSGYSEGELAALGYRGFLRAQPEHAGPDPMLAHDSRGQRVHAFVNRCLCKDGSERVLEWTSFDGADGLLYAVARDITERRRMEAELVHASSHDPVTGLQHHLVLRGTVAAALSAATVSTSLLCIGLDRFQIVNESVGYATADDILRRLASRMQQALGDSGEIARFAGDRFVVAIHDHSRSAVMQLAERLRAAVAAPIEGDGYRLLITTSIGVSRSPEHGDEPKSLLRRAEAAMAQAKREGRDRVSEFSSAQMQKVEDRLTLGTHLRVAIAGNELALHYQPQFRAYDRRLTGFEALLRWNCAALGPVAPARFIPIAEALGLMPEIGEWVLDAACRQARIWLDRGHRDFTIAVNISAQQLQRPGLVDQIMVALQRHDLPVGLLDLEMTESSLMENVDWVQRTLGRLQSLGIQLSLDDFGTGYSSLAYLKHFPIHKLKIDQRFVRGLPLDANDAAIAHTIITLAHQLRMHVAAEGVENEEQAVFLGGMGCDELQGNHLGRALPLHEAERHFPALATEAPQPDSH